ncbi:MAG: NIP7 pre-PUA domain-containing protein [Candidatus Nanoarchaeia archaeon]
MKQLKHFISRFTNKDIFNEDLIVIHDKQYFYQSKKLQKTISKIPTKTNFAGQLLGRIIRGQFHVTLSLLEHIQAHTTQKIKLDEKQAWLFTCKRDIFQSKDIKDETTKNIILVVDSDDIVIGLAKKQTVKGKQLYTPIYDIGEFMRREK